MTQLFVCYGSCRTHSFAQRPPAQILLCCFNQLVVANVANNNNGGSPASFVTSFAAPDLRTHHKNDLKRVFIFALHFVIFMFPM